MARGHAPVQHFHPIVVQTDVFASKFPAHAHAYRHSCCEFRPVVRNSKI